jgi:hypothetical protein
LLAHGRWFSAASSTTKTGRHDIAEKFFVFNATLNTKKSINQSAIGPKRSETPIKIKERTFMSTLFKGIWSIKIFFF